MLFQRMVRAARLEAALYEEVEADRSATVQALLVVVIASVAAGIGSGLRSGTGGLLGALVLGAVGALVGWFIWSLITYWLGTRLFGGTATYGELLRCIGFSNSPQTLAILAFLPAVGGFIALAAAIWALLAMIVAVRQALDVSTGKAIGTAIVGWVVMMILAAILGVLGLGAMAPGVALPGV